MALTPKGAFIGAALALVVAVFWRNFVADPAPPAAKPAPKKRAGGKPPGKPKPAVPWNTVKPMVELSGPYDDENPVNLIDEGVDEDFGGGFSFMARVTMTDLNEWSRLFDFSFDADTDSITCGNVEYGFDFHFTVYHGSDQMSSVSIPDFFVLGREVVLLMTVSHNGEMKVYQDGDLFAENLEGLAPLWLHRPHLIVGNHFLWNHQGFRGSIKDVKVWNQEVTWPEDVPVPQPGSVVAPGKPKPKAKAKAKAKGKGKPAGKAPPKPTADFPAFELIDQAGNFIGLNSYPKKRLLLYWYPKADTPGCTMEGQGFKELNDAFQKNGVQVLGVSADPPSENGAFKKKYGLNFPLLSDEDRSLPNGLGQYGRWAVLLGPKRKVVKFWPDVDPAHFPKNALKFIREGAK